MPYNYHESFYLNSSTPSGPVFNPNYSTDTFLDVRDFGAIGDYVVATGVGTDNTAAIQAAIDAAAGLPVVLPPGRYKTTAPLVPKQGTTLMGTQELRTANISSNFGSGAVIEFHGGTSQNCIEAIGTTVSASRVMLANVKIIDRRTSPAGGNGVYFEEVVNQTTIRGLDVAGFTTGCSVYVTATGGNSSDCVTIEDIWVQGNPLYGVRLGSFDNNCVIRDIKCDTTTAGTLAVVYVGATVNAVVRIESVKHENTQAGATILVDASGATRGVHLADVVSRTGTGGPVVQIVNGPGTGVIATNLARSDSGTLIDVAGAATPYAVAGTRLPHWVGGVDGYSVNAARLFGGSGASDNDRIYVQGDLYVGDTAPSFGGKLAVLPDTAADRGLTVHGRSGQSADYFRITDSASASQFIVQSTGFAIASKGLGVSQQVVFGKRAAVADTTYTILTTDYYVAVTSLTAPRTLTLPSAATAGAGFLLVVKDESGAAGTHNITVARSGSQTIDGATTAVISTNYGVLRLISTGSNWSVI